MFAWVCLAILWTGFASPFSPGSVSVLRANVSGEAGASLAVFIDEFSPDGVLIQTIALPEVSSPGQSAFSISAGDPYAGLISRSSFRQALLLVGYSANAGTPYVEYSQSYITRRVVAIVWSSGEVDTDSLDMEEFGGNNVEPGFIRCAASDDMSDVWITGVGPKSAGAGGAVRIINATAATVTLPSHADLILEGGNFTGCGVYGDRLYLVSETDGSLYALEDLHSFEPGLPGAIRNPNYTATFRNLTSGPLTAGGLALG